MTWEVATALIAISAPITAAIFSRRPSNSGVALRDFQRLERAINKRLDDLRDDLRDLRKFINDRF